MSFGFAEIAEQLLDNGYSPLPVKDGQKIPAVGNWTHIDYEKTPGLLDEYCKKFPTASTGLLLGNTCVIDIDVLDPKVAANCKNIVIRELGGAPCRYGNHPKHAHFFGVEGPSFKKLATKTFLVNGQKAQVEILCEGQQVVVFGTHPKTRKPYYWDDLTPLEVPRAMLSPITKDKAAALLDDLEVELAARADKTKTISVGSPPNTSIAKERSAENDKIIEALNFLDPQNYQVWIAIGHALKSGGEQYLTTFVGWSKSRPDGSIPHNFTSEDDVKARWHTFKPSRTSLAVLFREAAKAGWTGPSPFTLRSNSHTEIARVVLSEIALRGTKPVFTDSELWRYGETHWQKVESYEQRLWIQELDGTRFGSRGVLLANRALIDGVLTELHAMCAKENFFEDAPIGINCASGFISLRPNMKPELVPHSADLRQRFCVPVHWEQGPIQKAAPLTERFFSGIFRDKESAAEGRMVLQEILGAALAGLGTRLKSPKAFILHGPSGANGKSQFLMILQGMLPRSAHSAISPSDMGKEQFLAELAGKTANLANELSSVKVISSDKMKAVISGDIVSAKKVYQPVFQFVPRAVHVFTANILPSFYDGVDEGIRRRFVIVPFTETIPEKSRIPEIANRILNNEKEALLSLAVEGAIRIMSNGAYSISPRMQDATEEWFFDSDNLIGWLEEDGIERLLEHQSKISMLDAYKSYREVVENLGPGEWTVRYSVFKRTIRDYVKKHPELDIVRHAEGYRIVERTLV